MRFKNIELYFLNSILRISIFGLALILISNIIFFPSDLVSISVELVILSACIIAYFLRHKYSTASVLIVTLISLLAVSYQRSITSSGTSGIPVILIIGFVVSVMFKGRLLWAIHAFAMLLLITVFAIQDIDPITSSVTYITIYFVLAFGSYKLKSEYDAYKMSLMDANDVLQKQSKKMEKQYAELQDTQQKLYELNKELEKRVNERTARIIEQNEILIRYSYTNAHQLRGPVARLLGLASIYKLDKEEGREMLIKKMVDQAREIDKVIKQINVELAEKSLDNTD